MRAVARGCLLLLTTGLLIGTGGPALADNGAEPAPHIAEVSPDGMTYTRSYSGLFDGNILVPRGTATDSFLVKNNGTTRGYLRIVLTSVEIPNLDVLHALTISAGTTEQPGRPLPVSAARPCLTLLEGASLPAGQSVQVRSVLGLNDLSGTDGQNGAIEFSLEVLLSESPAQNDDTCPGDRPSPGPIAEAHPAPPGALAATGLARAGTVTMVAAAALALGSALALWRRRRHSTSPSGRGPHA